MGVIDKFLNTIKLNDDYDGFDDDFLDEEDEEYEEEERAPRRRILNRRPDPEEEEEEEDFEEKPASAEPVREEKQSPPVRTSRQKQQKSNPKVSPIRSSSNPRRQGTMEVCVIRPHSMEESREITETLLENCTVILNMEGLDLDLAQRIIDFSSGSCYALHGNLQKISNYIFIITPPGVDISGDFQEMFNGAVDVPAFGTRF